MKYTIHIEHELRLVRYTHAGIIKADEIGEAWKELLTMKEFTLLKYNLLSDYSMAKLEFGREIIPELVGFMRTIEMVVKGKKQALIIDEPYAVAASMIFENKVYAEIGFKIKVFSTETAALHWLSY